MSTIAAARQRFEANKFDARRQAALKLVPIIGTDFTLLSWGAKTRAAYTDQWCTVRRHDDSAGWDWIEMFRRYHDPDRLDLAVWSSDRLSGLALGTTTGQAVVLRFVERDPRADCPLAGRILLIVLECMANYAQARGRPELRVEPINAALETLYTEKYGFTLETPKGGRAYYRKAV